MLYSVLIVGAIQYFQTITLITMHGASLRYRWNRQFDLLVLKANNPARLSDAEKTVLVYSVKSAIYLYHVELDDHALYLQTDAEPLMFGMSEEK